jgi:hypothetical protein
LPKTAGGGNISRHVRRLGDGAVIKSAATTKSAAFIESSQNE